MNDPVELTGNPEHDGLSLAIASAFVVLVLIVTFIVDLVLYFWLGGTRIEYIIPSCFVGLIIGMIAIYFLDPVLKRMIPSGVVITLSDESISLERPTHEEIELTHPLAEPPLFWRRQLRGRGYTNRERQVHKSWYCYACQVQNEDDKIVLHTYIHPRQISELDEILTFRVLDLKELEKSGATRRANRISRMRTFGTLPTIPSSIIVGESGRYWLGERHRWEQGIELTLEDFKQVVAYLKK